MCSGYLFALIFMLDILIFPSLVVTYSSSSRLLPTPVILLSFLVYVLLLCIPNVVLLCYRVFLFRP